MKYRVQITAGAYTDLDRLAANLAGRWPTGVERLTVAFAEAIERLESFPLGCGIAYEDRFFAEEIRHLLFAIRKGRPHRALFTVRGDLVLILAVRAPGEKPIDPADFGR